MNSHFKHLKDVAKATPPGPWPRPPPRSAGLAGVAKTAPPGPRPPRSGPCCGGAYPGAAGGNKERIKSGHLGVWELNSLGV